MPLVDADTEADSGGMNGLDAEVPEDGGVDGGESEDGDGGMPMASCTDGRQNGDETGVDCGGPTCEARCPDLGRCVTSSDCGSRVCISGTCTVPSCNDRVRNGDETGADCGGPTCDGCGLGQGCASEDDCAEGTCSDGFCVAEHCFDTVRNVNETDVDCGGADCGPCNAGEQCRADRDCNMSTCEGGFCLTPACSNGMPDVGEVDVDCGGECPGCPDATACTMGADCLSGRCEGGVCTSCSDGAQNGAETGVDCGGGVCRGCPGGTVCSTNDDCSSRVCTEGFCEGAATYYRETFDSGDGGWADPDATGMPITSVCENTCTSSGGSDWTNDGYCDESASSATCQPGTDCGDCGPSFAGDLWVYAPPTATFINSAYTGTSVWVTNPTGDYPDDADVYLVSPEIDLSMATADPLLRFAATYESERGYDGTRVEVSIDGGAFTRVGSNGPNWYDAVSSSGETLNRFGSSTGVAWRTVEHTLVGTAGHSIRLRFYFHSDSSNQYEGFAFDDVEILEDVCNNGIADPAETDVDCGGELCAACDDGLDCVADADCASGVCDLGTCVSCDDGIENGGETDLDCGGADCAPCGDTRSCSADADCLSGRCEAGACTSCFDGILNGGETFIDCGGGGCGLCLGGAECTANEQCVSGACTGGVCEAPPTGTLRWTFDTDGEGWTTDGSLWEYGVPSTSTLSTPYTGTHAWITDADADYSVSTETYVESPEIDLRGLSEDPSLSLALSYESESSNDLMWIEMSVDGGAFERLGSRTSGGTNWYNSTCINAMYCGSYLNAQGWSGTRGTWFVAQHPLAGAAGHSVRLRMVFRSDGSVVYEGFAFDDVEVVSSAPDLAVSLAPSANLCDGVLVSVRNEGTMPVSFFDLLANVDGTMSTTRITQLLEPGDVYTVEVRASSSFEASVRAVGDADASNDTAMLSTAPRTIGARYVETFETDAGGWVAAGASSSWAYGTPSDTFIMNASSGSNAWVTNLTNDYNADEASYLVSPCFDFSGFGTDPTMSFSYIVDTQPTVDHAFVEISNDGGATWEKLGLFGTGSNWYNDLAGDFWDGRAGAAGEWIRATHPLVGAAGHGAVRVRVAFVSNMTVQREGVGIDDVIVMP
ncbi:MAG: immune inhibitor A [Sandaracinus sp.]|nr:immune inhibitor A [Sandaracinus sp.]MCB9636627.1 immune inhibitor A [Sandaracinus sp.]